MKMLVVNMTRYLYGAHATTMLVNDFVNARLGNYGPEVEKIDVILLYPPRSRPSRSLGGLAEFWNLASRSPQATFFRTKQRIEVRYVCPRVSVRSIEADGHLTLDEITQITTTGAAALELIRPKVGPADQFDYDSFLRDARSALLGSPGAIQQWLKNA